jgi:transcriptional regulator with XRE-family HTH domain
LQPLDAERVKEWRHRRMLSQQEVADRAGTSLFTIQRIERGEGNVRPKTGREVASALGVPIEELLPKVQAPLFRELPKPAAEEERRVPPLRSWIVFVGCLADRWEKEIVERVGEWQAAEPAVGNYVKRLPNLNWAVEISRTGADAIDAASEEMELALGVATSAEARELFRALKRLNEVIERTKSWFPSSEESPQMAEVIDLRQAAIERMERKLGVQAS